MSNVQRWSSVVWLWAGVAAVVLIGTLSAALLRWPPTNSADTAAWAQAVVTAIAVVVALGIPIAQASVDRAKRASAALTDRANRYEAAYQLAWGTKTACENLLAQACTDAPVDRIYLTGVVAELDALAHAFKQYSPGELDGYREVMRVVTMSAICAALADQLRHSASRADAHPVNSEVRAGFERALASIKANVCRLKDLADEANEAAGIVRAPAAESAHGARRECPRAHVREDAAPL
jgi:hypothetical protein